MSDLRGRLSRLEQRAGTAGHTCRLTFREDGDEPPEPCPVCQAAGLPTFIVVPRGTAPEPCSGCGRLRQNFTITLDRPGRDEPDDPEPLEEP